MGMVIHRDAELEAALNESARRRGVTPETLALNALWERFLPPTPTVRPRDEWERPLLGAATDCGVFLPHSTLSSEVVRVVAYLIDMSLLAYLANSADVYHAVARRAVVELHRRSEVLHVTPQNLVEFRNAAT
jgi:hypothetical protein